MGKEISSNNFTTEQIKQTKTLKEALEASLKDGKITPEEAKGLESKFLDERGNISKNAKQGWRKLSDDLRKDFQRKIGTGDDGKIGPGTMDALKGLASKSIVMPELGEPIQVGPRPSDNIIPNNEKVTENNSLINEDELYKGLKLVTDINNGKNFTININNPEELKIMESFDDAKKKEAQKLLDISKNIDGVDSGKIIFTESGIVALQLDTRGSDLYIQSSNDKYLVTGQAEGKFFTENISQAGFKKFVENYDSENTKRILTEIGFIGGFTFLGVMAFLVRTGIGLMIPTAVSVGLGAYRGYELYKMYNLSTNDTVSIGEKYKDNPEFLKKYLFLSELGYITGTSGDNFTTIDGETLSIKDIENKYREIKGNKTLEKKYLLLSQLQVRGYNPKYDKGENKYELDFYGFFDKTSLKVEGDKVILQSDIFNNGKEKTYSLEKHDILKDIATINEIVRLNAEKRNKESVSTENNPALNDVDGITKLGIDIKTLEDTLIK